MRSGCAALRKRHRRCIARAAWHSIALKFLVALVLVFATGGSLYSEPLPAAALGLAWRHVPGGVIRGPVAAGPSGSVYFQSNDWYLYRIGPDGSVLFRFDMKEPPGSALIADVGGTVVATTANGELLGVSGSGKELWHRSARSIAGTDPGGEVPAPIGMTESSDGLIFVAYRDGVLACLNLSGKLLWDLRFDSSLTTLCGSADGRFFVGDKTGRVYCFDESGSVRWTVALSAPAASVAGHGDRAYVVTETGLLVALGAKGQPLWHFRLGSDRQRNPHPNIVVDAVGDIMVPGTDGKLYGVTPDGKQRYAAFLSDARFAGCARGPGGIVYATTNTGLLIALGSDGAALFSVGTPEPADLGTPYVVGPREVVAGASSWVVYAFRLYGTVPVTGEGRPSKGEAADSGTKSGTHPREEAVIAESPLSMFSGTEGKDSADYVSLHSRIGSTYARDRADAVSEIADRVDAHKLRGSLPYVTELLAGVAASPFLDRKIVDIRLRLTAVRLLGYIGDGRSRRFLIWLAFHARDPSVLAATAEALGGTGTDTDEQVRAALLHIIRLENPVSPDPRIGSAVLACLRSIQRSTGGIGPAGARVLEAMISQSFPEKILREAADLLR